MKKCNNCGKDFEVKENQVVCPHCQSVIPIEDVMLGSLDATIRYVVKLSGPEAPKKKGMFLSMLPDLLPGGQEDVKLMRAVYQTNEKQIAAFVKDVAKGEDVQSAAQKIVKALHQSFYDKQIIDKVVSAFLYAYDYKPEDYLGGIDHTTIMSLSRNLHLEELADTLTQVQAQGGVSIWKDVDQLANSLADTAPKLREENKLLQSVGSHGAKELYEMMQSICNAGYQDGDEKMSVAKLQSKLRDAFMDYQAIDFFLEAVLKSADLEYTQRLFQVTSPSSAGTSVRPRKAQNTPTSGQGSTSNTTSATQKASTSTTTTAATSSSSVTRSTSGSSTAIVSKNTTAIGANNPMSRYQIPPTQPKKKHPVITTIAVIFGIYAVVHWVITPIQDRMAEKERERQAIEESIAASEEAERRAQEERDRANATPAPTKNPYESPKVSTSSNQGGIYKMNIIMTNNYGSYQGPESDFHFRYPYVLYDDVAYTFENEGKDIDIEFTCESDPSYLFLSIHPTDREDGDEDFDVEALKTAIMEDAKTDMKNVKVKADRQAMSMSSSDYYSSMSYNFHLVGTDADDSSVIVHKAYHVTASFVETYILKYPEAVDTEDQATKEFYAEVMYAKCGFAGNTSAPEWKKFKKNYGLE